MPRAKSARWIFLVAATGIALSSVWGAESARPGAPASSPAPPPLQGSASDLYTPEEIEVQYCMLKLKFPDPQVNQRNCAFRLGELRDERCVETLIAALQDPDLNVAIDATEALGKIGGPAAVQALIQVLRDDSKSSMHREAAKALGILRAQEAFEDLLVALQAEDGLTRAEAAKALELLRGPAPALPSGPRAASPKGVPLFAPRTVESLVSDLSHPDPKVRTLAVDALGTLKSPQPISSISALLRGPDESIRRTAAEALGRIGDPSGAGPLIETLAEERSSKVLTGCAAALGQIRDPEAVAPLIAAMQSGPWKDVPPFTEAFAAALAALNDPRGVEPLASIVRSDAPWDMRRAALKALGQIADPRAAQVLSELAEKSGEAPGDNIVRIYALEALGTCRFAPAGETLIRVLASSNDRRFEAPAAKALGLRKDPQAVEPLIAFMGDDSKNIVSRMDALRALGEIRDPRAAEALNRALGQSIFTAKACLALGRQKDPQAVEPLIQALESWEKETRINAAKALGEIGDRRATGPLMARLSKEGDKEPWLAALQALGEIKDPRARDRLLVLLADKDPRKARTARLTIQKIDPAFDLQAYCTSNPAPLMLAQRKGGALAAGASSRPSASKPSPPSPPSQAVAAVEIPKTSAQPSGAGADRVESWIQDLLSTNQQARLGAMEELGGSKDSRAVEPLISALKHPDPETRGHAAQALGRLKASAAIPALVPLMGDPSGLPQYDAAVALALIGPDSVGPLVGLLEANAKKDPVENEWAIKALGEIQDPRATEALIQVVKSHFFFTSGVALRALGKIRDPRAVGPLMEEFQKDPRRNGGEIIKILGEIGDPSAVEFLVSIAKGKDSSMGNTALAALGQIGDPRAIDLMLKALTKDGNVWAADWLASFHDPRAVDAVIESLSSPNDHLRPIAARALARPRDLRAVDPLVRALADKKPEVRMEAAWALGSLRDGRAVEPLLQTLKDPEWKVAMRAAEALGRLRDPRAAPALSEAAHHKDPHVQDRALDALKRIGDKGPADSQPIAPPALLEKLKDPDPAVRASAAEALGREADPKAFGPLIQSLRDKSAQVRREAARSLGELEDPNALTALKPLLRDPDDEVKISVVQALGRIGDSRASQYIQSMTPVVSTQDVYIEVIEMHSSVFGMTSRIPAVATGW